MRAAFSRVRACADERTALGPHADEPHLFSALHTRAVDPPPTTSRSSAVSRPRAWRVAAFWLVCVLVSLVARARAVENLDAAHEHQIKAAFLLNFVKYAKWPARAFERPEDTLVIAVLGSDPFGKVLDDTLRDKSIGSHKLEPRRFKSLQELSTCHLLFVAESESHKLAKIIETLGKQPVLVVGESDKFAAHGGCIGFFLEDKKVRFEINVEAVKRFDLELSSQLLKLARIVKDEIGSR